ncbi:MAG TPA: phosphoadenosine phosphosulfate reductase family protein, partial [Candidatus Binatia bacterium]|nr:phosphoadenosine phosphosulfate reductase family protein [Candidatus Binatia bacterium]
MALDTKNLAAVAAEYASKDPRDIIALALAEFSGDIAVSFSGAEDVVLVDMAKKIGGRFGVFSLDTGRLHPETYQFLDKVRAHYEVPVDTFFPQPEAVQKLVHEKGLF